MKSKSLSNEIINDYIQMRENNIAVPGLRKSIHPMQKLIISKEPSKQLIKKGKWSKEEVQKLREMLCFSKEFIAKKLNRTACSIECKKSQLPFINT